MLNYYIIRRAGVGVEPHARCARSSQAIRVPVVRSHIECLLSLVREYPYRHHSRAAVPPATTWSHSSARQLAPCLQCGQIERSRFGVQIRDL